MDVRERIQQTIEASDELTVRGVSLKAGLSDSALHKYLTGANQSISVRNLEKIADAMGVSLRWLMFGDEAEVVNIWDRIPDESKAHARSVLETFAKKA